MMHTRFMGAAALILALTACQQQQKNAAASQPAASGQPQQVVAAKMTPEQLGELGARIRKSPGDAPRLLAQHNLTAESFEAQIREVTENAEASKRYSASYEAASKR